MLTAEYAHITMDAHERAWVGGTNTKVVEIVLDHLVHGWTAEEIHFQHPHLPLGHIHSALAYYYDHREVLDAEIATLDSLAEADRRESKESPLVARLRAAGRI